MSARRVVAVAVMLGAGVTGCHRGMRAVTIPLSDSTFFHADSVRVTPISDGVTHRALWSTTGPWAVQVLEIDRSACTSFRAVKAHGTAIGREPTSLLLEQLASREDVIAGVNADFFSFTPAGLPVSTHIERGRMIAGPSPRPVVGFDRDGRPFIGNLQAGATLDLPGGGRVTTSWNRVSPDGVTVIDRAWGVETDTGTSRIEVLMRGAGPWVVDRTDTLPAGIAIPLGATVVVAGKDAPPPAREALMALHPGDTVRVARKTSHPELREVVGGWPIILRDGQITKMADSAGKGFADVRHPRTAFALSPEREWLVVVDGRQKPWSDGMTLRELAMLLRSFGATDAINLDGGGSSTFVAKHPREPFRIWNRPSDKGAERPVANALALVRQCGPQ